MRQHGSGVTLRSKSLTCSINDPLEGLGDEKCCRDPQALYLNGIVQTARCASASIADACDDHP